MTSDAFDASPYDQVTVEFYFYANSMESGEDFIVSYYNGSSWATVGSYASGSDFNNGQFYSVTITLDKANHNLSANSMLRIQCDASANADQVYIDQVIVTGSTGSARTSGNTISQLNGTSKGNSTTALSIIDELEMEMNLYPNPAISSLNIELLNHEGTCVGRIIDATGKTLWTGDIETGNNTINLDQLSTGIYYFSAVKSDGTIMTKKFIKKG